MKVPKHDNIHSLGQDSLFQQQLFTLVCNSALPMVFLDAGGIITFASEAFERLSSYETAEGMPLFSILDGSKLSGASAGEKLRHIIGQCQRGEPIEVPFLAHGGERGWISVEACTSVSVSGSDPAYQCVFRDIIREKRLQEADGMMHMSSREYGLMLGGLAIHIESPMVIRDVNGLVVWVNQSFTRMFGTSGDALVGLKNIQLFTPEEQNKITEAREQTLHTRQCTTIELLARSVDNSLITFVLKTFPIFDEKKKVAFIGSIAVDITERKEMETQLQAWMQQARNNEEILRTTIDNIPGPVFRKDTGGVYTGVNRAFCEYLGKRADEIIGKTVFELNTDKELAEKYHEMDMELIHGCAQQEYESQVRYADGALHDVIFRKAVFFNSEGGDPGGIIGLMQDVTLLRQAALQQEHLLEQVEYERRFTQSVLDGVPSPIYFKDTDGVINDVNSAYCEWTGKTKAEIVGTKSPKFCQCSNAPNCYGMDRELYRNRLRQKMNVEVTIQHADGTSRIAVCRRKVMLGMDGKPMGVVGVLQDITEIKRTQKQIHRSENRLAVAAGIARLGYWETDIKEDLFVASDQQYHLLGTTVEREGGYQMPMRQFVERFVHPDDVAMVDAEVSRCMETDDPHYAGTVEYRSFRVDGRPWIVRADFRIEKDAQGQTVKIYGINQDITRSRQAEIELERLLMEAEQSNYLMQTVINSTPDWIFIKNLEYKYVMVNCGYADSLHLVPGDFIGKDDLELGFSEELVKGDVEKNIRGFWADDQLVIDTGQMQVNPDKPATIDGEMHIFHTIKVPLRNAEGQIWGVLGFARDITGQKQIQEDLLRSEQRYRSLYNDTPAMLYSIDHEGRIISVSDYWLATMEYSREEVVGKLLSDFVTKESIQHSRDVVWPIFVKDGCCKDIEFEFVKKTGEVIICLLSAVGQWSSDGRLISSLEVIVDITELKRNQNSLRQSESRYRSLYNNTPAMLYSIDEEGRVTRVSDYWLGTMGYTREEVLGHKSSEFLTEASRIYAVETVLPQFFKTGSCLDVESQYVKKDGSVIDCLMSAILEKEEGGQMVHSLAVMTNITKRKQVERELWKNEQLLQSIMDNIPQSIFWKDTDLMFMGCNRAFAQEAGLSSHLEIVGKTDYDMPWGGQAELYRNDDQLVLESGEPKLGYEEPLAMVDGTNIWLNTNKVPLRDKAGKVYAVLGTFEDITDRKLHELRLEQSRKQLADAQYLMQDFLDNIPYRAIILDLEQRIVLANEVFARVVHTPKRELAGKYLTEYAAYLELQQKIKEGNEYVLQNRKPIDVEEEIITSSGKTVHLSTHKFPIYNSDDTFAYIGIIINDVSERVRREKELERSQMQIADAWRLLWDLQDNIPYRVVMLDKEERIVIINRAFADELQSTQQELIGKYYPDYVDAQLRDIAKESNEYVRQNEQQITLREQMISPEGDTVYLSTVKFPVYNSNGEFSYIGIIDADVTESVNRENELIRMQDEIERSRQFLQAFMDNASTAMFAKDLDGRYLMVNKKKIEYLPLQHPLLGHTEGEALENPAGRISFRREDAEVIASGHPMEFYDEVEQVNDVTRYYKTVKFPISDNHGNFLAIGGITNDITDTIMRENELKAAKGKAEDAASAQERFLAAMSHDMRTPLNGIVGMINLLEQTVLNTEQKEYMDAMKVSSANLRVLINDILDISKIQAGKLNIESVLFDLEELLDSVEEVFKHEARKKELDFSIRVERGLPTMLEGDPTRLSQILNNLIGNAMKFTATGFVQLSIRYQEFPNNSVVLTFIVEDSGIGISAEGLSRLFHSFSQAGSDTTRRFGGSGLGLSICKSLVELQKGEIGVTSELSKGSIFRFSIPYAKAIQSSNQKEERKLQVASNFFGQFADLCCLIVEDNLINQKVAFHILKKNDIRADIANNGREAIDILKKSPEKYDFILMDIQMPEMDGYQATTVIRNELGLIIPIVAMTASALKGEREHCLEVGMNDFVPKPFMIEELLYVINRLNIEPIRVGEENLQNEMISAEETGKKAGGNNPAEIKKQPEALTETQDKIVCRQDGFDNEPLYDLSNVLMIEDDSFTLAILNTFLETIPEGLQNLKNEVALANDWDRVSAIAHKLKGGVGVLQMTEMIKRLQMIEHNAKKREALQTIPETLDICLRIFDTVVGDLALYIDELSGKQK